MDIKELALEKVLFESLDALKRGDVQPWIAMFAEDGVMEFPFAPPGYPSRIDGRDAIADYMKGYPDLISLEVIVKRAVYHAPEAMIVEFSAKGTALPTGNDYVMDYIGVVKAENGKIKLYRDYWNPVAALEAMDGLGHLLELSEGAA